MLEATIVAVLAFVVWVALQGGIGLPLNRSIRKETTASKSPVRYSLRTLLISITFVVAALGVILAIDYSYVEGRRGFARSKCRGALFELRGDFLFDNIKNTLPELESLEQNMRDKFKQVVREFGMIFVLT